MFSSACSAWLQRHLQAIVCLGLMLSSQWVWAVACEDIWPGRYTANSSVAPNLPVFTGSSTLNLPRTLGTGDYHYRGSTENGSLFGGGNLTITGGVSSRVYINGNLTLTDYADLNVTGINTFGDPEDLILIINGNLTLNRGAFVDTQISGIIYVTGSVSIANGASVYGTVTAGGGISGTGQIIHDANAVANADFGDLCGDEPTLDRFSVSAAAAASVCAATPITLTALQADGSTLTDYTGTVNISTSSGHGNWSISSGSGTLSPNPDSDDNGSVQYTFAASDNGVVVLNLSNTHADQLTVSAVESGGTANGTSSTLQFSENAFSVVITDGLSTDFVAGRNHQLQVRALRQDPSTGECGVFTQYNGNIGLKSWVTRSGNDPSGQAPAITTTGANALLLNTEPAANNVTLAFASGIANIQWVTTDVGQYTWNLKDDSSGLVLNASNNPIAIIGSSSSFTVRPFALDLTAQDKRSPVAVNPAASSAAGAAFVKAGETFDVIVRGVLHQTGDDSDDNGVPDTATNLSDNTTAPAFGQEGETVQLTSTLLLPAAGVDPGLSGSTSLNSFSSGSGTTAVQFNEIGIIQIDAGLSDASYLDSGVDVLGQIANVGRFYPHLFKITDNAPTLRHGSGTWACDFTYRGQPFGFDTEPQITVTAYRFDDTNAVTTNYGGDFWKLAVPQHDLFLDVANLPPGSVCENGGSIVAGCFDENSASVSRVWSGEEDYDGQASWITGTHSMVINKMHTLPDAGDVPFDPTVTVTLVSEQLTDADGACFIQSGTCASYSIDAVTYASPSNSGMRWGRGWAANVTGSVSSVLPVPLQLQYWNNAGNFVTNVDDDRVGCDGTEVIATDVTLNADVSVSDALDPGETSVTSLSPNAGFYLLGLAAPGKAASGDANAGRVAVTWSVSTWLQYDFDGDDVEEDPVGMATFGERQDVRPILFRRERFR